MKKLFSIFLTGALLFSVSVVSFGAAQIDESGNEGSSRVTLNVASAEFKVTVPTVLPIDVDENNNVTVADDAEIINQCNGSVEVTDVSIESDNGWSIVPFTTDFKKVPVDTKQYGMTMYDDDVVDGVPVSLFDVIEGDSELAVVYDGNVAIQSDAIDHLDVGHVVFTIGWHKYVPQVIASNECGDYGDNVLYELNEEGTLRIFKNEDSENNQSGRMVDDNCLFINEGIINEIRSVTIEEGVTSVIGFFMAKNLKTVSIPSTVTEIGNSAFNGCTSLEFADIPNSVTTIGESAFNGTSIHSVNLPSGITEISSNAFYNCTSLTSITIPDSVTSIGAYAFGWCSNLERVVVPDSVQYFADGFPPFSNCPKLVIQTYSTATAVINYCTNKNIPYVLLDA